MGVFGPGVRTLAGLPYLVCDGHEAGRSKQGVLRLVKLGDG